MSGRKLTIDKYKGVCIVPSASGSGTVLSAIVGDVHMPSVPGGDGWCPRWQHRSPASLQPTLHDSVVRVHSTFPVHPHMVSPVPLLCPNLKEMKEKWEDSGCVHLFLYFLSTLHSGNTMDIGARPPGWSVPALPPLYSVPGEAVQSSALTSTLI